MSDTKPKTFKYKGITVSQSFTSPVTGRGCNTPQGWTFPAPHRGHRGIWSGSKSEAVSEIDRLILAYNGGVRKWGGTWEMLEEKCSEHIDKQARAAAIEKQEQSRIAAEKKARESRDDANWEHAQRLAKLLKIPCERKHASIILNGQAIRQSDYQKEVR